MSPLVKTISRYVQLTHIGREFRGQCPFCASVELSSLVIFNREDAYLWACFQCGAHEMHGGTLSAFGALVERNSIKPLPKPTKPIKRPLLKCRWTRCLPPVGSRPEFPGPRRETLSVVPEYDAEGRLWGYLVNHKSAGELRWIYVKYYDTDPGRWRPKRLNIRERIARYYPDMAEILAEKIKGLDKVAVRDLIDHDTLLELKGNKGKAVAFALQKLGWEKRHANWGNYYVRPATRAAPALNHD